MSEESPISHSSEDSRVVDLHLHSNESDGCDSPRRVMQRAARAGLRIVSLTDHDTVAGLEKARDEAGRLGLEFVNGIELSSVHDGRLVHILGHFFQLDAQSLMQQISYYTESRKGRMDRIIDRLLALGVLVDADEFYEKYGEAASIGRGQLGAYLVEKKLVPSREEAFRRYIGEDAPAYVELEMVKPVRAVEILVEAGGVATFAHPNLSKVDDILPELVAAGLSGIEVDHPSQADEVQRHYRQLAQRFGLVEMGGSDCHGERPGPERIGQFSQPLRAFSDLRSRIQPAGKS